MRSVGVHDGEPADGKSHDSVHLSVYDVSRIVSIAL